MDVKPLSIGALTVDVPVVLAPMAGYTDSAFRAVCRQMHCGLTFTEVVNAEALLHHSRMTFHLLETDESERPVGAHLYGSGPEVLAEAARVVEAMGRFSLIDINCGCPVRKIVAKGSGVALMAEPAKIEQIVRAVCSAVSLPVTVKTRIGLSPDRLNISEVADAVETGGASAIAVHGRFASNQHKGEADWDMLARIKGERTIPVIGNGGVQTADDVVRMFEHTGVDGVMIGRGAVGNPWLFLDACRVLRGLPLKPHSLAEHRAVVVEHLERLVGLKTREQQCRRRPGLPPDQAAALHFRAHLLKYMAGLAGWGAVRRGLGDIRSAEDVMAVVDVVLDATASGRAPLPSHLTR